MTRHISTKRAQPQHKIPKRFYSGTRWQGEEAAARRGKKIAAVRCAIGPLFPSLRSACAWLGLS